MKKSTILSYAVMFILATFVFLPGTSIFAQTSFVKYVGNPILPLGNPGEWDDTEAAFAFVSFDGSTYQMWYSGAPQEDTYRIGYATSVDGLNWVKAATNPVLDVGAAGTFDSINLWLPAVIFNGSNYEMWYSGGLTISGIGYATAPDPASWVRESSDPVLVKGGAGAWDENYAFHPIILRSDTLYHLWYSGQSATGFGQTGYATSTDGINWNKYQNNPVLPVGAPGEWDSQSALAGSVIFEDGQYHMWYHGTSRNDNSQVEIGYATSMDGINWTKHAENPILRREQEGWDAVNAWFPHVIKDGHRYRMWYTGRRSGTIDRLGYAEDFSNAAHVDSVWATVSTNSESVYINAKITNPHGESLNAKALIMNSGSVVDSVNLTNTRDSLWQGAWIGNSIVNSYIVSVKLHNISAGYWHNSSDWGVYDEFTQVISPVPDGAQVELVTDNILFGEGPVWHPDGFLLCSDLDGNRIFKIDPQTGTKEVYLSPSGGANGLAFDAQQNLIMCRRDERNLARLESDGTITVLASQYDGKRFSAPNDLTVRSDGTIFFTDLFTSRTPLPRELFFDGIYALKPDNELILCDSTVSGANGICLSPDEKKLYVNDSRTSTIYVFDMESNLTLTNKKVFAQIPSANFVDGMKVDESGLLFTAANNDGVWIHSPSGEFVDKINVPGLVTNVNWGDAEYETLYITELNNIYKIRLNTKGFVMDFVTDVAYQHVQVPAGFALFKNYPNPFNPTTNIEFSTPQNGFVTLKVYNLLGQQVATLLEEYKPAGRYAVNFDASALASGLYYYTLTAGELKETRKMVLIR